MPAAVMFSQEQLEKHQLENIGLQLPLKTGAVVRVSDIWRQTYVLLRVVLDNVTDEC